MFVGDAAREIGGAGAGRCRRPRRALPGAVALAAALLAGPAAHASAAATPAAERSPARSDLLQEADTLPRDTVTADTLPADTARAGEAAPDTAGAGREPYFPEAVPAADSASPATVWRCDRACLLDHAANNLLDLLEAEWPGLVSLRGTYYGGPHHVADGLMGAARTEVTVEELSLPPLAGGELDLTRVPVAWLSEVAVVRRAGELRLRLEPIRHRTPEAYSRVTAGTGQPNLNLIRGLFVNGIGNHLAVSTGVEVLNTDGRRAGSDRLDFWGMASWTPGDGSAGAELLWRSQNMTRASPAGTGAGAEEFRRGDVYLRGRGRLAPGVRLHLSAGRSDWSESGTGTPGPGSGNDRDGPRVETEGASFTVHAERPWGSGRASFETWTGPARPSAAGRLAAGLTPLPGLRLDAGARAGRWRSFSTRSYRGGVRWSPGLGLDLSLHASAAGGTRGIPRPWLGTADSLRFDEYRGGGSFSVGPYELSGWAALQDVSRQLPFSATFDREVGPLPGTELLVAQGTAAGPILPLEPLLGADLSPLRLELTYRRSRNRGRADPLYVPLDHVHSQLRFHDEFFQGDLGVTLRLGTRYRSAMTSVSVAGGDVAAVPARTAVEWGAVIRIVGARIWFRSENANRTLAGNLAGQELPPFRNTFGIKWEFTN